MFCLPEAPNSYIRGGCGDQEDAEDEEGEHAAVMDLARGPLSSAFVPHVPQVTGAFIVPAEGSVDMPEAPLPTSSAIASSSSSSSSSGVPSVVALSAEVDMEVPEDMERVMEAADHEQRELETVYFDYDTGSVHQTNIDGPVIGRISVLHKNTPKEAISVYCRRHGCSKLVRVVKAPSHDRIMEWFAAGLDIQARRCYQSPHSRLWPS